MSLPQFGGLVDEFFTMDTVPHVQADGTTRGRLVLRCRECFQAVEKGGPWSDIVHKAPCRVHDLIERIRSGDRSAATVHAYDALLAQLDDADHSAPS